MMHLDKRFLVASHGGPTVSYGTGIALDYRNGRNEPRTHRFEMIMYTSRDYGGEKWYWTLED